MTKLLFLILSIAHPGDGHDRHLDYSSNIWSSGLVILGYAASEDSPLTGHRAFTR